MATNYTHLTERQLSSLELKRCPFNRNHVIKMSGFQKHLMICQSTINSTELKNWRICPFNSSHYVTHEEYATHVLICTDNKPYLREALSLSTDQAFNGSAKQSKTLKEDPNIAIKGEPKSEVKEEPLIDFNDKITIKEEDVKEEDLKPEIKAKIFVSKEEEDSWYDSRVENYSIYQKPESTTAEDLIKDDKYWFNNKGSIDPMSYSRLSQPERKRLTAMMVHKQRAEAARPPIQKHIDPYFTFHPILKVVEKDRNSAKYEFCNPILQFLGRRAQSLQSIEEPIMTGRAITSQESSVCEEDLSQYKSLYDHLHYVKREVNYEKMVISDANCGHENEGTVVGKALRQIVLSQPIKREFEVLAIPKVPFRLPKTNPFDGRLRKPNTNDSKEVVFDVNNNKNI